MNKLKRIYMYLLGYRGYKDPGYDNAYYRVNNRSLYKATDVQLSGGVRANHTVKSELAQGVEGSNK